MALLTPIVPSLGGVQESLVPAAAGGDTFPNDGYTTFKVANGSGVSINVTFAAPGELGPDQNNLHDASVVKAVPAGKTYTFGPFSDKKRFNDASGNVAVTYSAVASITVAPIRHG